MALTMSSYIVLAMLCLAATPALADELYPMEAKSISVGGFRGIVYYTHEQDGYHVTATIAEGESGLPVRFEATITERQKLTITVPRRLGEQSYVVELLRVDGKLVIAPLEPAQELAAAPNLDRN
jgi:hypothetical protein